WGPEAGIYLLRSVSGFKFRVDTAFDYNLTMIVDPGDSPSLDGSYSGSVSLAIYNSAGDATLLHEVLDGQLAVTGRLGPGTYMLQGLSGKFGPWETFQGPAYFAQWTVQQPAVPTIAYQPSDHSTACGGTVVFSVGTASPPSNYTFQWRRNFTPLTDGPGVSGATTPTLTLTNACSADDYDVVVTGPNPAGGTISEPSRLAHLSIISTPTGIETDPVSESPIAQIRAASPNPFRAGTALSYTVPRATRLRATVYDASGARVRDLTDVVVSGPGSIVWDGRTQRGDRAPAGVYFVHVDAGAVRETKKVVLLK
ncbi:MAG TPA: T9SS type A sorting domain-containing protein, partial [Candidatus Eisenbacteria bacterium]|nr:T9SS type A sorting domain-containing protein [Candidatus Eisenbacteria bacterium]